MIRILRAEALAPQPQTNFLSRKEMTVSELERGELRLGASVTWVSLFIPRGILSASSSPAAALSTVHMPPQLRSSFRDGAANPVGELDKEFRGARALSSITPPAARRGPPLPSLLLQPPPSPLRSEKWKWAGERQAAGGCFLGGYARGEEASWRNRRGQMPPGPRFVPAGRMQGANCLIAQERFLHGPATPRGKSPPCEHI